MKRAPIVLAGTAAGVAGILAYNTSPSTSAAVSGVSAAQTASTQSASTVPAASATATTSSASVTKTTTASRTRTAIGSDVSFQYGDVEVKVTKRGSRVTDVSIVRFDITDQHSQEIDQVAVPELRQQAIAAQSAKIEGVSGASYTSAAYEQSLQSALDKLA